MESEDTKELTYKTERGSQTSRTNFWLPSGRIGGRDREFRIDVYTLLYLKWITNKDLLYSTCYSAQRYVAA